METTVGDAVLAKLSDVQFSEDAVAKCQVFLPKIFVLQNEELKKPLSGNGSVELTIHMNENVL